MNIAHKKSSFDLFSKAYSFATLFAITPRFESKHQAMRGIYYNMYTFVHVLIITAIQVISFLGYFYSQKDTDSDVYYTTIFIPASRELISFFQYMVTVLGAAFWNRKIWVKFYNRFSRIEAFLHKTHNGHNSFYIRHFNTIFILTVLSFICVSSISIATIESNDTINYLRYISKYYYLFCENVKMSLIFAYSCGIHDQFHNLRVALKKRYTEKLMDTSLTTTGNLYRQLCDLAEIFNSLFGFQILLSIVQWCIMSLETLNIFWIYMSGKAAVANISHRDKILCALLNTMTLVRPVMVIFGCDWVIREAMGIPKICYKYQENFDVFSGEKQELLNLAYQIQNSKPEFTAAGSFEVDRTTIFALFGTVLTYFVVMIQLDYTF